MAELGEGHAQGPRRRVRSYQVGYKPAAAASTTTTTAGWPDQLAAALLDLQELTARLRRDCPWDREQTARTIVPHTVEEAYEVADAAMAGDPAKLVDELGDLLFQTYFLALLLEEQGHGDLASVARRVHAKLVTRHPHVFGDAEARTAGRVRENWERIKAEQEGREGIFHDVPETLPALLYARKLQRRAAAIGFEYPDAAGALGDLDDELAELKEAIEQAPDRRRRPSRTRTSSRSSVTCCSPRSTWRGTLNVDPELALRSATRPLRGARRARPSSSPPATGEALPSSRSRSRTDTSTARRRSSAEQPRSPMSTPARSSTPAGTQRSRSRSGSSPARVGRAAVPSGASTGQFEAVELRDGDAGAYAREGRRPRRRERRREIADAARGMDAEDQRGIDAALDRARRDDEQGPARRERDPRRLARRREGRRRRGAACRSTAGSAAWKRTCCPCRC